MAIIITLPNEQMRFTKWELRNNEMVARDTSGVYLLYDKKGNLLYVGKSGNLRRRLLSHISGHGTSKTFSRYIHDIQVYFCDDPTERELYETYLINKLKPKYNTAKAYYNEDEERNDEVSKWEEKLHEIDYRLHKLREERREIRRQIWEGNFSDFIDYEYDYDCEENYPIEDLGGMLWLIERLKRVRAEIARLKNEQAKIRSKIRLRSI